jgi:hypothetical protein
MTRAVRAVVQLVGEALLWGTIATFCYAGAQHLLFEPSAMTVAPDSETITVLSPEAAKARRDARKHTPTAGRTNPASRTND